MKGQGVRRRKGEGDAEEKEGEEEEGRGEEERREGNSVVLGLIPRLISPCT